MNPKKKRENFVIYRRCFEFFFLGKLMNILFIKN